MNALTKQFEISSQQEKVVPLKPRKSSNVDYNGNGNSRSRVVVIDKSQMKSHSELGFWHLVLNICSIGVLCRAKFLLVLISVNLKNFHIYFFKHGV